MAVREMYGLAAGGEAEGGWEEWRTSRVGTAAKKRES